MATLQNILLEQLTWPEVETALNGGATTVVVACGAVEQHGPHLPLFMDAEHGVELAAQVAHRLGNALAAPTIRVGCSEHHMGFRGTISLRKATFQAVCIDYAASLSRHGFRSICFIPTHGGNFGPLAEALPELRQAAGDAKVVAFLDLDAQIELWRRVVEEEAGLGRRVGGHADIAEASIMLALHPGLVRQEEAVPGYPGELTPEVLMKMVREGIGSITANGILGDPRGMSAGIGRSCIAATADMLAAYFREQLAEPPP